MSPCNVFLLLGFGLYLLLAIIRVLARGTFENDSMLDDIFDVFAHSQMF